MLRRLGRFLLHATITLVVIAIIIVTIGLTNGAALHYGDDPVILDWEGDGPYVFFEGDSLLSVEFVRGNKDDGFRVDRTLHPISDPLLAPVRYAPDGSGFTVPIDPNPDVPAVSYDDGEPILAISDIEGNYGAFRHMLQASGVVGPDLEWIFEKGHLVLLGDFVDRGFFSTQTLWFIHRLEQEATQAGGRVHYILGNHEIKNLQGDFMAAVPKYHHVASILGRQQFELVGEESVLGKWLESRNTAERINGILFVHGGIHPAVADSGVTLEDLNRSVRGRYRKPWFPRANPELGDLLTSTDQGPSWYRGYFKGEMTQEEVDRGLRAFGAHAVVAGHTIVPEIEARYGGKVFGIDVEHPADDHRNWPARHSEALLIDGDQFFRILDTGRRIKLGLE